MIRYALFLEKATVNIFKRGNIRQTDEMEWADSFQSMIHKSSVSPVIVLHRYEQMDPVEYYFVNTEQPITVNTDFSKALIA